MASSGRAEISRNGALGRMKARARPHSAYHSYSLYFRQKLCSMDSTHDSGVASKIMIISHLDKLNPQQVRAVEHGGSALAEAGPPS